MAEITLRLEIPRPTHVDLLEFTALIATKDAGRRGRVTARWLERWLEARGDSTIDEVAFATSLLQQLGGKHHVRALDALRDMAEAATSRGSGSRVAL